MTENVKNTERQGNTLMRMLPGLIVTVVALAALFLLVDLEQLSQAFTVDVLKALPLALLMFVGTVSSRAMAWRTTLKEKPSLKDSFLVLNQGYLLNNVLPFRLGELGRALLLGGRTGLSFWQVLSSIVVERVFDLGFAAGLLLATLPFVVGGDWAYSAALVSGGLVIAGFVVLYVMASQPELIKKFAAWLTSRWPKLQTWATTQLDHFLEGLSALRDPWRFLRVAFWMLLTWVFNLSWYFVLLRSFFPQSTLLWAAFSIAVASVGVAIPSSPAYVGVLEAALVGSLTLFGADASVALAYALAAHVIYFVATGLIGIYAFWAQGESLGRIYQQLLHRSEAK